MRDNGLILLVDDEPALLEALAATLESRGFGCVTATNMSAGVAALRRHPIRAVVTDIMMPGGALFADIDSSQAGFHFIAFVQQNWPGLPIVCLSVIGDPDRITSLKDLGVRYLRKGETPLSTAVEVISASAMGRRIRI